MATCADLYLVPVEVDLLVDTDGRELPTAFQPKGGKEWAVLAVRARSAAANPESGVMGERWVVDCTAGGGDVETRGLYRFGARWGVMSRADYDAEIGGVRL